MSTPSRPPYRAALHKRAITKERAMTVVNHVAEEWADHGITSFCSKAELCQTIQWLRSQQAEELQRKDMALDRMVHLAIAARLYISDKDRAAEGLPTLAALCGQDDDPPEATSAVRRQDTGLL